MLKQPQLRRCTISISTIWKRISVHCCEQEKKKGKENGKKTSNCWGTNCFCPFVTTAVSSWACLSLPTLEHICRLGKPFHFHWIFCVQSFMSILGLTRKSKLLRVSVNIVLKSYNNQLWAFLMISTIRRNEDSIHLQHLLKRDIFIIGFSSNSYLSPSLESHLLYLHRAVQGKYVLAD